MRPIFTELVTKVKPNTNSVEVHPQLSNIRHPVDDALVGGSSHCAPNVGYVNKWVSKECCMQKIQFPSCH